LPRFFSKLEQRKKEKIWEQQERREKGGNERRNNPSFTFKIYSKVTFGCGAYMLCSRDSIEQSAPFNQLYNSTIY
jgi:hypothetical protein